MRHHLSRPDMLDRLQEPGDFDLAIIGGGATGLGVAVDAASRGLRVCLFERDDFASATSSRSTKLIHGGVRYLRQGQIGLVRDALRERGRLLRNAPRLVEPLRFLIPTFSLRETAFYATGLKVYDLLAGRQRLEASRVLSREAMLHSVPGLRGDGLYGGVAYTDARFDDAGLALALARTAASLGAVLLNDARVVRLTHSPTGRIHGLVVVDQESGREWHVEARVVVNATGAFTDEVLAMDTRPPSVRLIQASRGSHVVLGGDFLGKSDNGARGVLVPRTADGRVVFALPFFNQTLVGTTDVAVDQAVENPRPDESEIDFLLETVGRYLSRRPERRDVCSVFAGVRPLVRQGGGASTKSISRDHYLAVSSSGLVTITGGKWTTYRQMAEEATDRAIEVGRLRARRCVTANLALAGATEPRPEGVEAVDEMFVEKVVREEMARSVEDVLSRRSRLLLIDARAAMEAAPMVARVIARQLGHDEAWIDAETGRFLRTAQGYLPATLNQASIN